ncbi:MAG: isocitrate lyase/phosphoenolpyruvate mutase family protein [Thermoprotei archaeon]
MGFRSQSEKAEYFRSLHHGSSVLVLPNAWDVPTARLFEGMGFRAVATTSAGMMVSLGYEDGERIPFTEFLSAVSRIARVLTVPLTVDVVAGFGSSVHQVASSVKQVVGVGAVGINIEDFEHETKKLFRLEDQVEKIKAIRKLGEELGVNLVVNARTDALRYAEGGEEERFREAVRRGQYYRDAGADCVYPMGLTNLELIKEYVGQLSHPVNIMVTKDTPNVKQLENAGVKRLSFGPSGIYGALGFLKKASHQVLEEGTYTTLLQDAINYDELNRLTHPVE